MQNLEVHTRLVRNPRLVSTDMDGETVLMSIEKGMYYGFRQVAARTWELLRAPRTLGELCRTLREEYEVDEETCQRDVSSFVLQLVEHDLVQRG